MDERILKGSNQELHRSINGLSNIDFYHLRLKGGWWSELVNENQEKEERGRNQERERAEWVKHTDAWESASAKM